MKGWSGRCVSRVEGVRARACARWIEEVGDCVCAERVECVGRAVYVEGVLSPTCALCIYRFVERVRRRLVLMEMSLLNAAARQTHLFCYQPVVICFLPPPHLSLFCLIPLASSVEKQLCALIIGVYNFADIPRFGV